MSKLVSARRPQSFLSRHLLADLCHTVSVRAMHYQLPWPFKPTPIAHPPENLKKVC
jgi:hypothetical protein